MKPAKGQVWKRTHRKIGSRLKPVTEPYMWRSIRGASDVPLIYVAVTATPKGLVYYADYVPGEPKPTKREYVAGELEFTQMFEPAHLKENTMNLIEDIRQAAGIELLVESTEQELRQMFNATEKVAKGPRFMTRTQRAVDAKLPFMEFEGQWTKDPKKLGPWFKTFANRLGAAANKDGLTKHGHKLHREGNEASDVYGWAGGEDQGFVIASMDTMKATRGKKLEHSVKVRIYGVGSLSGGRWRGIKMRSAGIAENTEAPPLPALENTEDPLSGLLDSIRQDAGLAPLEEFTSSMITKFNSKTPQQLHAAGKPDSEVWVQISIANATRQDHLERSANYLGNLLLKLEGGRGDYGGVAYGSKRMSTASKIAPILDKAITAAQRAIKTAEAAQEASAFLTYRQEKALMRKGR